MPFYRVIHCNRMQLCLRCTFSLCRIDLQQLQDCTEETIPFPTTKPKKARPETPKRSTPEQSFTDVPTPTHPQTPLVSSCNISYQERKKEQSGLSRNLQHATKWLGIRTNLLSNLVDGAKALNGK